MENELKELMQLAFRDGKLYGNVTENGAPVWSPETRSLYQKLAAAWNARAGAPAIDAGEVERLVDRLELMVYRDADKHSDETARDAQSARAALLAAVTAAKGGR